MLVKRLSIVGLILFTIVSIVRASYTTATFSSTSPVLAPDGRIYAEIIFTGDNNEPLVRKHFYASSPDDLKKQVADTLSNLNRAIGVNSYPKGGVVPAPTSEPAPTQAEIDRRIFFNRLEHLCAVTSVINSNLITANITLDSNYINLKNDVNTRYQSAYILQSGWPMC